MMDTCTEVVSLIKIAQGRSAPVSGCATGAKSSAAVVKASISRDSCGCAVVSCRVSLPAEFDAF
jgi:hypothetical protein